ncbi:MAG: MFS transporter [Planctomycetota bacterium]
MRAAIAPDARVASGAWRWQRYLSSRLRSRWLALTGVAVLVAGFCQVGYMATANTVVQETVPDVLRGRVMGIWALMFGAAYPIGGWLLAALAERTSTSNALMTFGIAGVVGALLAAAYALRVRRRQAERATA